MANVIPGINTRVRPNVYVRNRVRQNVAVAPGGARTILIMGEGVSEETLVVSALGRGRDGVNPDFSGTNAPDGRHFQLSAIDLVPNRTSILKNGIALNVLEQAISVDAFDSRFDARVDPATGRVQLQGSSLVDFGNPAGSTLFYKKFASNVGNGTLNVTAGSLLSDSAPGEVWTVRCIEIKTDSGGAPIGTEATFSVTGSVTGVVKNSAGNPIVWKSDSTVTSNGILSFAVVEGATKFRVGDKFTIEVTSGVLIAGDKLEAEYIPNDALNDPQVFTSTSALYARHGIPSVDNTLSLGAAMAFENGAGQVVALQCKPPVPRATSETVLVADNPLSATVEGARGTTEPEDCIFALNPNSLPDADSKINIFVVNSDGTETQVSLNKVAFYDASVTTIAQAYTTFVTGSPVNSYTVFSLNQTEQEGTDGYLYTVGPNKFFASDSLALAVDRGEAGESDLNKYIYVYDETGTTYGRYSILEIGDGLGDNSFAKVAFVSGGGGVSQLDGPTRNWQLVDEADKSAYLAVTDDFVTTKMTAGKGLRISFVDSKDADFFDSNWASAFEAAESANAQIIVPLPTSTISSIFLTAKNHVIDQSSIKNGNERVLVIGGINGLAPDNVSGVSLAAVEDVGSLEGIQGDTAAEILAGSIEDLADYSVPNAYGDTELVVYVFPDRIVRNIGGTNTTLSGYFAAAAVGGLMSAKTNTAEPLTNKTVSGFTIERSRAYRPAVVNQLLSAGVCLLEPVSGGGRIVHGLTTAQSGAPEDEEISIVEVRQQVTRILRASLRPYIGKINSPTLIQEISGAVDKVMRSLVSVGLLTGYSDIVVARNPAETRQIDIGVKASPAGPLNWISADIEFSMGG